MTRATIADVAKRAGVSAMTVSRVINRKGEISPATRDRVQQAIDDLGYRPSLIARSLSTQRSRTLGLIVPDITNPFFPEVVRGAEDVAWQEGYSVTLCNTVENAERERAALELLEDNRVDGVLLCSARLPDEELAPLLARQRAVVLLNRPAHGGPPGVGSLLVDDTYGTLRAVHHLLGLGRRRIGFLAGPERSFSAARRLEGYTTALAATGAAPDPDLIEPCEPDESGGCKALVRLLRRRPDLDGLVCYNDLVAIGALQACREQGVSVPETLAVIGCDDIRMASLVSPSLTTLAVDKYALGRRAAGLLIARLRGETLVPQLVKPELIVRRSAP